MPDSEFERFRYIGVLVNRFEASSKRAHQAHKAIARHARAGRKILNQSRRTREFRACRSTAMVHHASKKSIRGTY
jgi:hypothetical protein